MAIAQSRVIYLIESARDYQQALQTLISHIHSQLNHINRPDASPGTARDALYYLANVANEQFLLKDPIQSPSTITLEHKHFATNFHRNRVRAIHMQNKRREDGREQRTTYDPSIDLKSLLHTEPKPPKNFQEEAEAQEELTRQWEEAERKRLEQEADENDSLANNAFSNWKPNPS
jgi:hypothetical protein